MPLKVGVIAFFVVTPLPEGTNSNFLKPGSHVIRGAIEQIIWCQQVVEESTGLAFPRKLSMKGTERDLSPFGCMFFLGKRPPKHGASWWLNQPIWQILYSRIGSHFPQGSGVKTKKIFELPPAKHGVFCFRSIFRVPPKNPRGNVSGKILVV